MVRLVALAYTSSSVGVLPEGELEALLLDARRMNQEVGVTGVLLYDEGTFFQYIEGPEEGIDAVFKRIKASSRHRGLIELFRRDVGRRDFGSWAMGFSRVPQSQLLRLTQAEWLESLATIDEPGTGLGGQLLGEIWRLATRRGGTREV